VCVESFFWFGVTVFMAALYCGQAVEWIKIPYATWYLDGLILGHVVLDEDPPPRTTERGTAAPHTHFSAHFAMARSPISATAELL